jgi:hypothetical protein
VKFKLPPLCYSHLLQESSDESPHSCSENRCECTATIGKGYPPAQARVKEREREAGQKDKIRIIRLQQNSKNEQTNKQKNKQEGR